MKPTFIDFGPVQQSFAVDTARRTIKGILVPWDGIGSHSNGDKWRFTRGSVRYVDPKYVAFNDEHDRTRKLGRGVVAADTDAGLELTFRVDPGPEGDQALEDAASGRKTGLSMEVDIDSMDTSADPADPSVMLVSMANLTGAGHVKNPAFKQSQIISVVASYEGASMKCTKCNLVHADGVTECVTPPTVTPDPTPTGQVTFSAEQFAEFMKAHGAGSPAVEPVEPPAVVNPTKVPVQAGPVQVKEPLPYSFSAVPNAGPGGKTAYNFSGATAHDFSTDILSVMKACEMGHGADAERKRLDGFIHGTFADVEIADLPGTLTSQRRPDMWVPQRDYATPLWDLTGRGAPPNGGQKFDIPKFTSASGLVAVATEKTEPAGGSFVDELQTITPGQLWGKVEIFRQAWRQAGNPALSGILWEQMVRSFMEAREAAIATFLATLTAATDIALVGSDASPSADEDQATMAAFEAAYADLQFVRGGNRFNAFAVHQALYRVAARTKDDAGRPMYPMINPQNSNGIAASKYRVIDVAGSTWVPSYALGTPANASTNSWLFDSDVVLTWAGAPERMFWDFGATVQSSTNLPQLSAVTLGLYADYAVGNTDIAGVRQVTYDPNTEA